MTALQWDKIGSRTYESGLDRGVLYLPSGFAVPWNGLVSVVEKNEADVTTVFYDGMKVADLVAIGDYAATLSAVTYPDEFAQIEGTRKFRRGVHLHEQPPQVFGLSYRTRIGNDVAGESVAYKLNLVYNITAVPSDKAFASESDEPTLVEFEWDLSGVPEEWEGFRPTSHISFDSREIDPFLLEDIEGILYGTSFTEGSLPSIEELSTFMSEWFRVKIIDNEDGTWTAISDRSELIQMSSDGHVFTLISVNALFLDDNTYVVTDTYDIAESPLIAINNLPDGTWTATTGGEDIIVMLDDHTFEIRNANAAFIDDHTYVISSTVETD